MKIKGMISLVVLGMLTVANASFATETTPAEKTVSAVSTLIQSYKSGNVQQGAQTAIDTMVKSGAELLREKGYAGDAARFSRQWKIMKQTAAMDLGDHAPLSQWLADYYEVLAQRFGEAILKQLHLDDLLTLNYAIPVVFHPAGKKNSQTTWDLTEYRKHFVPFAGVVSYWVAFGVCTYASTHIDGGSGVKQYCGQIAGLLRKGMIMYPAPKLSDWVYGTANRKKANYFNIYGYRRSPLVKKDVEFLNEVLDQYSN